MLEDKIVGCNRQEPAAGPFVNMDTAVLAGLNVRMLSVIKRAQQQQQQQQNPGTLPVPILLHSVDTCSVSGVTLCLAFEQSLQNVSMVWLEWLMLTSQHIWEAYCTYLLETSASESPVLVELQV